MKQAKAGILAAAMACAAMLCTAHAQESGAPPPGEAAPTLMDVFALLNDGKVMPALAMMERLADDFTAFVAQFWAISGDVRGADSLFARIWTPPDLAQPDLSDAAAAPALDAILREAQGKRVVILNEAHHSPRHRAFSHRVMLALREAGFTHFAAETFCNGCEWELLENGAPTTRTGGYTADPVFGDLVRQAAAAGYRLVAYEQTPEQSEPDGAGFELSVAFREQAQAENLKAMLDTDPAARIFVHVGFSHANEAPMGEVRIAWMAARLKRMLGEDILTIDQVEGTPQADEAKDSPLYRAFIAAQGDPAAPVALANDPEAPLGFYRVDLSIVHPGEAFIGGRPDWLAMEGYRRPHELALGPMEARTLIRAFVEGEPENAIPMDQILAPAGAESVTLMLPPGDYRLVRQTEAGEDIRLGALTL